MIGQRIHARPIMVHPSQRQPHYTPRKPSWSLTFRRGDTTRAYPIRPFLVGSALGLFVLLLVAYVGATAYLVYRDDLLGAAVSRQVEMQYSYEDRIAALRAELDRVSSRHAVQTEGVEQQLATLLDQQETIERRQAALDVLVGQARAAGISVASGAPRLPQARPGDDNAAGAAPEDTGSAPLGYLPEAPADDDVISKTLLKHDRSAVAAGHNIRPILSKVGASLERVETRQSDALDALSAAAGSEAGRLTDALSSIGVDTSANMGGPLEEEPGPRGGPFVPPETLHFVERTALLKGTLDDIAALRQHAVALPVRMPVKALYISSRFGYRVDPFLKRKAFHAGLDFVAEPGTPVRATAPGTVVFAGSNGGYGEMVEIRHADGVSTRYGHLSKILVARGTQVEAGAKIGLVGSTGRSTGPHLHYETRRDGDAVNPALYLAAGKALRSGS